MVPSEVHWFERKCVGVMEMKEVVCHFCVSACFCIMEVSKRLREELATVKSEMKGERGEQNADKAN